MKYLFVIVGFLLSSLAIGQESKLANEYYRNGEYEKASQLYERLYIKSNRNDFYFNRYLESLLALEEYSKAEKIIKDEIKRNPGAVQLYVSYGNLYERKNETEKAEKEYRKAIKNVPSDVGSISRLANAFLSLAKYDLAIEVYEKASEKLNGSHIFSYSLADLYRRKGNSDKMLDYYLLSLLHTPNRINSMKNIFQRYLSGEEFELLQAKLYTMIQEFPDEITYPEMLQWVFVHRKDYKKALRQARALDRRLEENGARVYELASIAQNGKVYDAAIDAYEYIIENKGPNTSFYISSKVQLLDCKRKNILQNVDYTQEDLLALEQEYESFLKEFGKNTQTVYLIIDYARFEALYLNKLDKAISILEEVKSYAGLKPAIVSNIKLDLGDYYLIKNDIWEATLLYSQVDKAYKEGLLGERARYRNALLSYYRGDFEWAQKQFDILKSATSKLISNDAIDMSVFIMDNLGLDTTAVPLQLYAEAELLLYQNKYEKTFEKLDQIIKDFPEHGLKDDILYIKARMHVKRKHYADAISFFEQIIENHAEEIRCDNAIWELAELYQYNLQQPENAQPLYEKLFLEFTNSTFAIEARKRYRELRGDEL
jgi:tetratricopeptide (TPR) repeat protein